MKIFRLLQVKDVRDILILTGTEIEEDFYHLYAHHVIILYAILWKIQSKTIVWSQCTTK